jgi:hypothetical protein
MSAMNAKKPLIALLISFCILHSAFCIASPSDHGDHFTDEEPIALDLGGKTREVEKWSQGKWNSQPLSVTNGTLVFTKSMSVHGGMVNVASDATLRFARGSTLATGLGDAGTRVFNVAPGGKLDMDGIGWNMDHTRVLIPKSAEWNADLTRLTLLGAMKDNLWDIGGKAVFPRGIRVGRADWGCALKIILREGGEMLVGGPVSTNGVRRCGFELVLEGGTVTLFWDAKFEPGLVRVAPGATVKVRVAKGASFDEASVAVPDGAKLEVVRDVSLPEGLPERTPVAPAPKPAAAAKAAKAAKAAPPAGPPPPRPSASDKGDHFADEEALSLDLGGKTREVEKWQQNKWNSQILAITNGTLAFTKSMGVHGGPVYVASDATLRFARGCFLATGTGDAGTRIFNVAPGGKLDMDGITWNMDHTRVILPKGSAWNADIARLSLMGAMKDNLWDIGGHALFPRGIKVAKGDYGPALKVVLREGGELLVGGPVSTNGTKKCGLDVVLEGGAVTLFWNARFDPGIVRVAPGATVEVRVAKGTEFDEASVAVPEDATLKVVRDVSLPRGLPDRYMPRVRYDRTGRSWWVDLESVQDEISDWTVTFPNPDVESSLKTLTEHPAYIVFRRRFPAGPGPWKIGLEITDLKGNRTLQTVEVSRPEKVVVQPAPNDLVMVGITGYGVATNIARDILKDDLCNLYVGWNGAAKTLPRKVPEDIQEEFAKAIKDRKMWSMSIYAGDGKALQDELNEAYEGRYLGNNCGEYASFMYQGRQQCCLPMNIDIREAKERFVNRYCGNAAFGWISNFPWVFSTCGAALSCYELAGGIDFICNEQWAIGAMNIAHTSAEARGAARKWGPEYWCAWNAHEWQTQGVPYHTDQKYLSCLVGFLQEYVFGTSMIVLESGVQNTQAWQYTASYPGQPREERAKEEYDGYVAQHYRETVKNFYDWTKANPRDKGTPETKIAMALGNLDAYLGQCGGFTVWCQFDNATNNPALWKYGPPERTQSLLEDIFFPRPKNLMEPFGNAWLAGTPFGQVDVMQVDDESTIADLRRYDLLVFGGWNTMYAPIRDLLERYVKEGGTLVMSRPELTTRVDRDFINYTDADLMPPFGFLPPEGAPGEYVEKRFGKGRYFLFTARTFPDATKEGREAYKALVKKLAGEVKQSATISSETEGETDAISFSVYQNKAYFLNMDTRRARTFDYVLDGKRDTMTLKPCEIRTVDRNRQ